MSDKTMKIRDQMHIYDGVFRYLRHLRTRAQLLRNTVFQAWAAQIGLTHYLLNSQPTNALFLNAVYSSLCTESIDPVQNDELYNKTVNLPSLRIFQEIATLVQRAYQCNEKQTQQILQSFLDLTPIKNLFSNSELFLEQALFEKEIKKLQEHHILVKKEQYQDVLKEVNQILDEVCKTADFIRKHSDQIHMIFTSYYKAIQSGYNDLRYTVGCLIGIFDILQFTAEDRIENYFRKELSAKKLYFFQCNPPHSSLRSLLVRNSKEDSTSIRHLYEKIFFTVPLNDWISPTPEEREVIQDRLDQRIWIFQKKGSLYQISLDEMKQNYLLIFHYLVFFKYTIAGLCFKTKNDLDTYLSNEIL